MSRKGTASGTTCMTGTDRRSSHHRHRFLDLPGRVNRYLRCSASGIASHGPLAEIVLDQPGHQLPGETRALMAWTSSRSYASDVTRILSR